MDLNQVIYTVFHAEFESGSRIGPKPPQDPIFTNFWKIMTFIKIVFFILISEKYRRPWSVGRYEIYKIAHIEKGPGAELEPVPITEPIRLRDFYIFSTEFSSYTRHTLV